MAKLFGRACQVIVGPKNSRGLKIRDLRIVFRIERNAEKQPNPATIEIWNLSKDSRAVVEDKNSAIILEAGYGRWITVPRAGTETFEGELKRIFTGDVAQVRTERRGPDIVTVIEAGDGESAYQQSRLDASFKAGTTSGQVLDAVVKSFGLTKGQVVDFNEAEQFPNGIALTGPSRNHMDTLTRKQGLEWSIQDDQIQILPPTRGTTQEAVLLNKSTGLVGTPYKNKVVNQSLLQKKDAKEAALGTKATSLLNGEIFPGRLVKVESDLVNGTFKVVKCVHDGDTHGQNWYTNLEAK